MNGDNEKLSNGTPAWFKLWYANHFVHLRRDVFWMKWIGVGILGTLVGCLVEKVF